MNGNKEVRLSELRAYIRRQYEALGLTPENTSILADVLMRSTMYGRGHHDVGFIPTMAKMLAEGKATPNPNFTRTASYAAVESWDGDCGLGPICCMKAMDRAIELALEYGIGMCCMRRTNHFLAAGPYVQYAAERGMVGLILAKGGVTMGAPGAPGACMSALPMGYAYPTMQSPVIFDACMAYASMEKLRIMGMEKQAAPAHWGYGQDGQPSEDPVDILKGTRLPIGGHKGFALAMLGEVLTGALSGGCVMDEKQTQDGLDGAVSHTAIAIKADALMELDTFQRRAGAVGQRACELRRNLHIPGEGAIEATTAAENRGTVFVSEEVIGRLAELAKSSGVEPLVCES